MCYLGFREEHSLAKMLPIRAVAHRPPDRGHGVRMDLTGIAYVFFLATIYTGSPKTIS